MKKIIVSLGTAPNGIKCWSIAYDQNITKDSTCGTSIEKPSLDAILPKTQSDDEYWLEVAKYACGMLEEKLINKNDIYNFEFICNGISYRKTK